MTQAPEDRTVEQRLDVLEQHDAEDMKSAVKEAIKEWLDEQFARVGKWTVNGVLAAGLAALVYFILVHNGWRQAP